VNGALLLPLEKSAETVSPGIDVISPVPEKAPVGEKLGRGDGEESGNVRDLFSLHANSPFPAAAFPALFAFKSLHKIILTLFDDFIQRGFAAVKPRSGGAPHEIACDFI
jgi:hypothetical protein